MFAHPIMDPIFPLTVILNSHRGTGLSLCRLHPKSFEVMLSIPTNIVSYAYHVSSFSSRTLYQHSQDSNLEVTNSYFGPAVLYIVSQYVVCLHYLKSHATVYY